MNTRPRLLFLCQTLPYPPDSGVAIRILHVLRLLARTFDVTALCFSSHKRGAVPQDDLPQRVGALRQLAEVEVDAFPLPQEHSFWRLAWDHVRSLGLNRVYTAFVYDSASLTARLGQLLQVRRFDLIHVDSLKLSRYLPLFRGVPVVCGHHNVESVLLQRRAQVERTPWRRAYLRYQARLMAREERRWCPRCDLNILVSDADCTTLQRSVPEATCAVVPMGRASDALRRTYHDRYAVELTGYAPDVRPHVRDAACYIVPLRVGGGTRLKILDAWAMGKAVVSTSVGCEGLAAEDGRNILIRDDPESFAQAVCTVLRNAPLRRQLGAEGRHTVEQHYSWEPIGESMRKLYSSLLQSSPRSRQIALCNAMNIA